MKTVTLTADEAVQKVRQFAKHYSHIDMAECDWFAGRTVDDLNLVNAFFDCYIPVLVASRTLSRRSALYQDSKPFLKQDIGFDMDKMSQTDFYNAMNKIVHHDIQLFFLDFTEKKNDEDHEDRGTLVCIIELLKRQIKKDKANDLNVTNMKCHMNYINYLNSYMLSRNLQIKDLIKQELHVKLNINHNTVSVNSHLYSHEDLLKLLQRLDRTSF